jgi:hypothetical protein
VASGWRPHSLEGQKATLRRICFALEESLGLARGSLPLTTSSDPALNADIDTNPDFHTYKAVMSDAKNGAIGMSRPYDLIAYKIAIMLIHEYAEWMDVFVISTTATLDDIMID